MSSVSSATAAPRFSALNSGFVRNPRSRAATREKSVGQGNRAAWNSAEFAGICLRVLKNRINPFPDETTRFHRMKMALQVVLMLQLIADALIRHSGSGRNCYEAAGKPIFSGDGCLRLAAPNQQEWGVKGFRTNAKTIGDVATMLINATGSCAASSSISH